MFSYNRKDGITMVKKYSTKYQQECRFDFDYPEEPDFDKEVNDLPDDAPLTLIASTLGLNVAYMNDQRVVAC